MTGETDLKKLLATMAPLLHEGDYVFCTVTELPVSGAGEILCTFREAEGWTLVMEKGVADGLQMTYGLIMAWITLTVHSSLEAVGLTAAVSRALAEREIGCNVIAAYYHDHIFVARKDAEAAMLALRGLGENGRSL